MKQHLESTRSERFTQMLYGLDRTGRGVLRGALEGPSYSAEILRYVEPYAPPKAWPRKVYFLVAALYGRFEMAVEGAPARMHFVKALKCCNREEQSHLLEQRFQTLLNSDGSELGEHLYKVLHMMTTGPYRLREPLCWAGLLDDLLRWEDPDRPTQRTWARL